ncbi:hypothetical protein TNCV_48171 [Trichonephila clavipes]|nr:hypothetical protein TNCV_48171 [Trichonephila clavipes]
MSNPPCGACDIQDSLFRNTTGSYSSAMHEPQFCVVRSRGCNIGYERASGIHGTERLSSVLPIGDYSRQDSKFGICGSKAKIVLEVLQFYLPYINTQKIQASFHGEIERSCLLN